MKNRIKDLEVTNDLDVKGNGQVDGSLNVTGNITTPGTVDGVDVSVLKSDYDAHIADTVDAHDASAISNVPAGNLAATTVQAALDELQTDVDTRATTTALDTHKADTTNPHSVTAAQVGNTTAQWNASQLQGRTLASTAPSTGNAVVWDGSQWAPGTAASSSTLSIATKTASYTLTTSDGIVLGDASAGAITFTLPAASGNAGLRYKIIKSDSSANAITIDANGTELINGVATQTLNNQYSAVEIVCDGAGWYEATRRAVDIKNAQGSGTFSASGTAQTSNTFVTLEPGYRWRLNGAATVGSSSSADLIAWMRCDYSTADGTQASYPPSYVGYPYIFFHRKDVEYRELKTPMTTLIVDCRARTTALDVYIVIAAAYNTGTAHGYTINITAEKI